MPLNIDINFRWLSQKPDKKDKKPNEKKNSSSSSSSSTTKATRSKRVQPKKPVEKPVDKKFESDDVIRRLIIMRHGERVDRVFPDWINQSTTTGAYSRYDTNLPTSIPDRMGGFAAFVHDAPITTTGRMQSQLMGQAIRKNTHKVSAIYCSPALRCVQTASAMYFELSKIEEEFLKIRVEPALFDWMGWYVDGPPLWMSNKELCDEGIPVDTFYKPITPIDKLRLNRDEDKETFTYRCEKVIQKILASSQETVLIITHATNIDACSRNVLSLPKIVTPVTVLDMLHFKYPYCCTICLEQVYVSGKGQWRIGKSLPTITGLGYSTKMDMEFLLRQ